MTNNYKNIFYMGTYLYTLKLFLRREITNHDKVSRNKKKNKTTNLNNDKI